jgi:hypothetical protein
MNVQVRTCDGLLAPYRQGSRQLWGRDRIRSSQGRGYQGACALCTALVGSLVCISETL